MADFLENKNILVTGGTGSFGRKFVEIILKKYRPKTVRVFSRDELKQFEMQQALPDERLRFFIGDVREKDRLQRAMSNVDIVLHAAALKQVPSCEYNPFEAVKTNILGAKNVVESAIDEGVEKAILISTDKAVNPVNLYGATKLCAEKIFIQGNTYAGRAKTKMSVVRYGNVMGSRGSVIPLFREQQKKAVLTITDERMTRFWITQQGAVNFTRHCLEVMQGGEVFIPKLPSMRIIDLAKAIAPEAKIVKVGIRPGEKVNELLLTVDEARHSKELAKYYIIEPEFPFWTEYQSRGVGLPEGFSYRSDNNNWWLSPPELKKILLTI